MNGQEGYISLYQFTKRIEGVLMDPSIRSQWVTMEINSINVNRASGHCYMEVVEKSPSGQTMASAKATIWASTYRKILFSFVGTTGMELQKGMKILANASANYHPVYGLSVNITDIDPSFTLGENERIRRETMRRLHEDGIWDMNKRIPIPTVMTRFAVVSSPTAAGYGDFCRQIGESGLNIGITLFDSLVQGSQAEKSIMESLERICARESEFDAIVIIRGGGATGDMDCFDGYNVCSAIAQMPLPVITGIGHDRDTSIADMVSAIPLKTPTAVAAWITDRVRDYLNTMERLCTEIFNRTRTLLMGLDSELESKANYMVGRVGWILSQKQLKLSECRNMLSKSAVSASVGENSRIVAMQAALKTGTSGIFSSASGTVHIMEQNLVMRWNRIYNRTLGEMEDRSRTLRSAVTNTCARLQSSMDIDIQSLASAVAIYRQKVESRTSIAQERLRTGSATVLRLASERQENLFQLLKSHDPKNVLGRGYAIVKKDGRVMPSGKGLRHGEKIEVVLRDATLESTIEKIK